MANKGTIRIEGLRELQRAFAVASKEMSRDLRSALESAAEPVRSDAQELARQHIPRIGLPWSRMRTGVVRGGVYVAPVQRGLKSGPRKRPNLAGLLLGEAMEPALERNRDKAIREVEDAITDMAKAWARVG